MTKEETFPLHRCIFRNDVEGLNKILKDKEASKLINTKDNHGNTPLHLALMLDRRNCVLSLIRNSDCDCVTRNNYGWNPLEEATMLGDMDLIEKLTMLKFRDYKKCLNKKGGILDKWNESLPNFHYKAHLKFKSKIPLLDKIGIKDTENFYKRGNNFRFDIGFSGVDLRGIPRMIKGSMSFIITFKENGFARLLLLDNKAKRYTELYPELPQGMMESYLKTKMDVKTLYKFYGDFSKFRVKKKSTKGFGFNNKKRVIKINGNKKYNTDIYKFKDLGVITRKRDNEEVIGDYKSHIKTTVRDLDKSRMTGFNNGSINSEINQAFFSGSEKQIRGYVMEDIIKQEKELSGTDSDSDSDDSDIEDDAKSESTNESHTNKLIEADNDFKKFIDENIYNITSVNNEVTDKIIQMIINGKDSNGNTIEKSDILYVNQIVPSFYSSYLSENNLPSDQQKKLEDIVKNIVQNGEDYSNIEKSTNDSKLLNNLKNSNNVTSLVHNFAGSYYNNSKKSSSSKSVIYEETKKEAISEEEYFDPKNTESIHMGRVMEISEERRHVKSVFKAWLTKENAFPLNTYQFMPIIEIFCLILYDQVNIKPEDKDYDREIYYNIANHILQEIGGLKRFPLKFEIPVLAGTVLQYKFAEIDTDDKGIPESLFNVPSDYIYDETVSFKFIK